MIYKCTVIYMKIPTYSKMTSIGIYITIEDIRNGFSTNSIIIDPLQSDEHIVIHINHIPISTITILILFIPIAIYAYMDIGTYIRMITNRYTN